MNKNIKTIGIVAAIILVVLSAYLVGCKINENITNTPIQSANAESFLLTKKGNIRVIVQDPAETTYEGENRKITHELSHIRLLTPFGPAPGETLARREPIKIDLGDTPAVGINSDGVNSSATTGGSITGPSGNWGIFDTIWQRIKDLLWFAGLGTGVLILIYFLVPAAQPILGAAFRAIASIIPVIGSIVENIAAKLKWKKPLQETVIGGQSFKDEINKNTMFSEEQKELIREMFNKTMMSKQDKASQKVVKAIKMENDL